MKVGRHLVGRALWLIKYMVSVANFVGGGLDPVGVIGAGAELFVRCSCVVRAQEHRRWRDR
jgi:hypothetical protein